MVFVDVDENRWTIWICCRGLSSKAVALALVEVNATSFARCRLRFFSFLFSARWDDLVGNHTAQMHSRVCSGGQINVLEAMRRCKFSFHFQKIDGVWIRSHIIVVCVANIMLIWRGMHGTEARNVLESKCRLLCT